MTTLIFATNNANKIIEVQQAFEDQLQIIGLKQAGINIDIEEPYDTLEENAREKCRVIHQLTGQDCFGEDTGLEVMALNNAPGVKTARYAGEQRSDVANMRLLLTNLNPVSNRSAQFRTVIALIWKGETYLFVGICTGSIAPNPNGTQGFGYDPVFIPAGSNITFAQMNLDEKNKLSHRKKAMAKMVAFIKTKEQETKEQEKETSDKGIVKPVNE